MLTGRRAFHGRDGRRHDDGDSHLGSAGSRERTGRSAGGDKRGDPAMPGKGYASDSSPHATCRLRCRQSRRKPAGATPRRRPRTEPRGPSGCDSGCRHHSGRWPDHVAAPTGDNEHPARIAASIAAPQDVVVEGTPAIAPDGRTIAFVGSGGGAAARVFVRSLDRFDIRAIAGTDGADGPFWSPDGRSLGFFARGLWRVDLAGNVRSIAPVSDPRGGVWGPTTRSSTRRTLMAGCSDLCRRRNPVGGDDARPGEAGDFTPLAATPARRAPRAVHESDRYDSAGPATRLLRFRRSAATGNRCSTQCRPAYADGGCSSRATRSSSDNLSIPLP